MISTNLLIGLLALLACSTANAQVLGGYDLVDWQDYWVAAEQDWIPVDVCQGDCEGSINGNKYCREGLECRLATVEDSETCGGVAIVGAYYCFPDPNYVEAAEEEVVGGGSTEVSVGGDLVVVNGTNATVVAFTFEAWILDEATDTWYLPTCSGGCDEDDANCMGDNICVLTPEDAPFSHPLCSGEAFEDEYYCVPPIDDMTDEEEVVVVASAQEAVATFAYGNDIWFREDGEWKLPTCGAGCGKDDQWCLEGDVCVEGDFDALSSICQGEFEEGWSFCVPAGAVPVAAEEEGTGSSVEDSGSDSI